MIYNRLYRLYHIEKCGGSFINNLLVEHLFGSSTGGHCNYKKNHLKNKIHKGVEKPLIIGLIRNPYNFYLSLWSFGCQKKGEFYRRHIKIRPTAAYLYEDSYNYHNFKVWVREILGLSERIKNIDLRNQPKYGVGLLTIEFIWTYLGDNYEKALGDLSYNGNFDYFLQLEKWKEDVIPLFQKIGMTVGDRLRNKILDLKPLNKSDHDHISKYYDQKTKNLIRKREWYIFEKFGYT